MATNPFANPFAAAGAASSIGKANASVDSAMERAVDGTANAFAQVEARAAESAAAVGSAASKGASAVAGTVEAGASAVASRAGAVAAAGKGLKPSGPKHLMKPHLPRAHFGTTPMKFSFQAEDLHVTMTSVGFEGRLVLAFKRGNSRRETDPMQLKEGLAKDGALVRTASTPQDLALIVTMFRRKDGSFEKKEAAFTVVEEGRDGSERKLGTERFDLAEFAGATSVPKPLDLVFAGGTVTLRCVLSARWLRRMSVGHDANSDDDNLSVSSFRVDPPSRAAETPEASLSSLPQVPVAAGAGGAGSNPFGGADDDDDSNPFSGGGGGPNPFEGEDGAPAVWVPSGGGAAGGPVAEARQELRQVTAELEAGREEARQLKAEVEALRRRQRELRRAQGRDDVVLQLSWLKMPPALV